jgi:hypothetical protein
MNKRNKAIDSHLCPNPLASQHFQVQEDIAVVSVVVAAVDDTGVVAEALHYAVAAVVVVQPSADDTTASESEQPGYHVVTADRFCHMNGIPDDTWL